MYMINNGVAATDNNDMMIQWYVVHVIISHHWLYLHDNSAILHPEYSANSVQIITGDQVWDWCHVSAILFYPYLFIILMILFFSFFHGADERWRLGFWGLSSGLHLHWSRFSSLQSNILHLLDNLGCGSIMLPNHGPNSTSSLLTLKTSCIMHNLCNIQNGVKWLLKGGWWGFYDSCILSNTCVVDIEKCTISSIFQIMRQNIRHYIQQRKCHQFS